jgi:hypothetical protein
MVTCRHCGQRFIPGAIDFLAVGEKADGGVRPDQEECLTCYLDKHRTRLQEIGMELFEQGKVMYYRIPSNRFLAEFMPWFDIFDYLAPEKAQSEGFGDN